MYIPKRNSHMYVPRDMEKKVQSNIVCKSKNLEKNPNTSLFSVCPGSLLPPVTLKELLLQEPQFPLL